MAIKTAQKRFSQAINALKLEVDESIALSIFELHIQAKQEYAREVAEDLRKRVAENACLEPNGMLLQVNKESILDTEIITPLKLKETIMKTEKIILDATAGSRMMWFDKDNPIATFLDRREETHTLCDGLVLEVKPDVIADFCNMPFDDESFHLVVFDPPHLNKLGKTSWMAKKYGVLGYHWRDDIRDGLAECMRVLKPNGVLIFKWNEVQIKLNDIMPLLPSEPLFGHTSGKNGKTIWMTFIKTKG